MKVNFKKIEVDNFKLQLSIFGKENKEPIFGIHGISSNSQVFSEIAKSLKDNFTLYSIDLRGRGHSDAPGGYNLFNHANDIKKILDKIKKFPLTIMGHSLGAYIALLFAALFPEYIKKVILIDGGAKLSEEEGKGVLKQ